MRWVPTRQPHKKVDIDTNQNREWWKQVLKTLEESRRNAPNYYPQPTHYKYPTYYDYGTTQKKEPYYHFYPTNDKIYTFYGELKNWDWEEQ